MSQTKYAASTTGSAYKSEDMARHKNLVDLTEGIVGIRNISYYCYLNAFMQCLAPIIDRYFIKSGLYVPGNQVKILISNKFCFTGKNVE